METLRIELRETDLEKLGSASLIGRMPIAESGLPKKVVLVFPQTTMTYRREHGPKAIVLMEYNIPCLIHDVAWLIRQGVEVSVEMPETEDK
jgi:hypothetical protein